RDIGTNHAGKAVAIRKAKALEAEDARRDGQFLWMRTAAQEREIGCRNELDITGQMSRGRCAVVVVRDRRQLGHAKNPCRYQRGSCAKPRRPRRNSQNRLPLSSSAM